MARDHGASSAARASFPGAQIPSGLPQGVSGFAGPSEPLGDAVPDGGAPSEAAPGAPGSSASHPTGGSSAGGSSNSGASSSGGGGSSSGSGASSGATAPPEGSGETPTEGSAPGESTGAGEPATSTGPFRFFASTSFWNAPLASNAPLDPNSAALVGALGEEVAREEQSGSGPWINTTSYSVPVYTVPAGQATVAVKLATTTSAPALQAALDAVPLPANAQPAAGTDGELVVWQPSSDQMWEFWRLAHTAEGWQASWSGAMQHVSSDSGAFEGASLWPGATTRWGVSASAMSLVGGLISLEDLQAGAINHALSMSLPAIRSGVYASPAQRCDGRSTSQLALPEGAHLRLDPSLDLAALHLPHLTLMIAQAAQRYGIYIKDGARNVTFDAQDPTPTGTEPYGGASGYFEGRSPRELLAAFPWSHLQVLDMQLHADC